LALGSFRRAVADWQPVRLVLGNPPSDTVSEQFRTWLNAPYLIQDHIWFGGATCTSSNPPERQRGAEGQQALNLKTLIEQPVKQYA
jgi:hypothetical protein